MDYQVMPDLRPEEYEELKADIAARGVMVPIEYDERGNVLDGHHRIRACAELGISDFPKVIRAGMDEAEKRAHARKLNLARRHLTAEQRRELIRDQLTETPEKSDRRIADGLGVDHKTIGAERKNMERIGEIPQCPRETKDGRTYPACRRPVSIFNPTAREAEAVQNPAVLERLRTGGAESVAEAVREERRAEIVSKLDAITAKEAKALQGVYDAIVIDPPWPMQKIERDDRPNQSEFDYPVMTESELAALKIPAAESCHMWLWTTHKFLPMALRLLEAWGFKYVCAFVWHKPGGFQPFGLPQYNCEFSLYARRGTPEFIDAKAFPTCFNAPRGAHSEKPDEFYDTVRRVTAGRRADMFNRRPVEGFDAWGKEASDL
ncbi:MAG: ParB N-terminal domain-containing protein [Clostridiales Family XIII bacterium]|jgi:N6-adenosine-specific RNA methylase IME4|nr:ParB N-terminal domain-containing protein [Clostridiales Family XIII bacterium]